MNFVDMNGKARLSSSRFNVKLDQSTLQDRKIPTESQANVIPEKGEKVSEFTKQNFIEIKILENKNNGQPSSRRIQRLSGFEIGTEMASLLNFLRETLRAKRKVHECEKDEIVVFTVHEVLWNRLHGSYPIPMYRLYMYPIFIALTEQKEKAENEKNDKKF